MARVAALSKPGGWLTGAARAAAATADRFFRHAARRSHRRLALRLRRPTTGAILGWTVMVVAAASEGLTLLGGVAIIGHSMQLRAHAALMREQRLVLAAAAADPAIGFGRRIERLAGGLPNGRLFFVPLGRDRRPSGGDPSALLTPDLLRQLAASHRPAFRQDRIDGERYFSLYTLIDGSAAAGTAAGRPDGVLIITCRRAPFAADALSERDGLIGTALLTLILLGYALVGVSQWLGMQLETREGRVSRAKRELELALGHMSDGLCVADRSGRITIFNDRFREILGLAPGAVTRGADLARLLPSRSAGTRRRRHGDLDLDAIPAHLSAAGEPVRVQQEAHDGRTIEMTYSPVAEGGCLLTCSDITERMRAQKQIAYMAEHDGLTGLGNRAAFSDRLVREIASATEAEPLAVLCLDLDHFKQINDEWGHPAGDAVLRAVAERLRRSLRDLEGTGFRLGGDEFAVLLTGTGIAEIEDVARRLLRTLNQECEIAGRRHRPQISIGIALAPRDAVDPDRLMSRADLALYAAKRSGRNTVQAFHPDLERRSAGRAAMETMLQRALADGQLALLYQPIFVLASSRLVGFEALLRWNHPERGPVPPSEFIGIAEDLRIIEDIGLWTIEQACGEAAGWPESVGVSVNLSAAQLRSRALPTQMKRALVRSGLAPARLELEVTETALIEDPGAAFAVLGGIKDHGMLIALDDFGTGYSSLSFLTRFKFDSIKIDRSFVRDMDTRADCAAIVEALSSLGAHLGLTTTAEGIETPDQLRRVRELGCGRGQGYLLGHPMPAAAARARAWREATPGSRDQRQPRQFAE